MSVSEGYNMNALFVALCLLSPQAKELEYTVSNRYLEKCLNYHKTRFRIGHWEAYSIREWGYSYVKDLAAKEP